jgi:GntR family transcriptional repressor for pyruvate dehydrogenase complex
MKDPLRPVARRNLSDRLAGRINAMIRRGGYRRGDRLPPIIQMAQHFGVAHPTIREALKKLETTGLVQIRHGSGVYVAGIEPAIIAESHEAASIRVLLDVMQARIPLEEQCVAGAARNATAEHLRDMRHLLATAARHPSDEDLQHSVNVAFHRQIALASGNPVLAQLLHLLQDQFSEERRQIRGGLAEREPRNHEEHLEIVDAIEARNEALGMEQMRRHLEAVRDALRRADPRHRALNPSPAATHA